MIFGRRRRDRIDHALADATAAGGGREIVVGQPFYDTVPVPLGEVTRLLFWDHSIGSALNNYADTNAQGSGMAFTPFVLVGAAHQLVEAWNRTAARRWWNEHARFGHFSLHVGARAAIELPLDALPLLQPFASPFEEEYRVRTWRRGVAPPVECTTIRRRNRFFAVDPPWKIEPHTYVRPEMVFPSPVNETPFSVRLFLFGYELRPLL
jgi:hypothetical protein